MFSKNPEYSKNSLSQKDSILPGGGGQIPENLNLHVFGNAIFEWSDEDKMSSIKDDLDQQYSIYALENKKLLF